MWRVLVVILVLSLGYYFLVKNSKQKTSVRDRTGDLLVAEHLKDVYNHDILDDEVSRMLVFSG
jgi:hypothetical protein